jgi:hypothetical protein
MTNVSEQDLSGAASYPALQAARTAFQAEAAGTPAKQAAGMELTYCMRDCLTDLGNPAAHLLPERP